MAKRNNMKVVKGISKGTVDISKLTEKEVDGQLKTLLPDTDPEKWLGLNDDEFRGDRKIYIENKWNQDHPSMKLTEYDSIIGLCNRSRIASQWLAKVNSEYSNEQQVPIFFTNLISPEKMKELRVKNETISSLQFEYSDKVREESEAYKTKLNALDNTYKPQLDALVKEDKYLKIANLPSDMLPLTMILAIESYNPKDQAAPTRRAYARECLIRYKVSLLKKLVKDENFDVDKYIDDNSSK